jgi:hypothetical protein
MLAYYLGFEIFFELTQRYLHGKRALDKRAK